MGAPIIYTNVPFAAAGAAGAGMPATAPTVIADANIAADSGIISEPATCLASSEPVPPNAGRFADSASAFVALSPAGGTVAPSAPPAGESDKKPMVFDFGRVGQLSLEQRKALVKFLIAAQFENTDECMDGLIAMMSDDKAVKRAKLKSAVERVFDKGGNRRTSEIVQELFSLASAYGGDLHSNYLQFIKAVVSWEGVMRRLVSDADFATYAGPVILKQLTEESGDAS